ncbi:MAG: hypothetical protein KIT02_12190 [Devosia sp.]|uniref:COG4223 family protein n=1 Tax=Devosia sp. TaxID=1871048 RepID=UPI0024CDDB3D|nr:hypothetical protein [Devosia sp.]UYN98696.1 MAG: hypothetical protein KIT02_12190 [Devosia sp.]
MADTTGKDKSTSDPKSASGAVRPPVLDGTARPAGASATTSSAGSAKPGADAATSAEKPAPTPRTPPPTPEAASGGGAPWLAGLLGGAIGLGAAYGLAVLGYWPAVPQAEVPADPRIAQVASAVPELQTVTNTVQDELSRLSARVATIEAGVDELATQAPEAGTGPSAEALSAFADRLDALEATAAAPMDGAGTDAMAADLAALRQSLETLTQQAAGQASQIDTVQSQLDALTTSAAEATASDQDQARLPLIFSGLESAFASGRPYETELAALIAAQPGAAIPEPVTLRAADGLPRPADMARRLAEVLPAMLAGRPVSADASWQDNAADWFRGVIAMRPAGEVEGTSPDAVVARLEAAIARQDFAAAQAELTSLPEPMQLAAGPVAADIGLLAEAGQFLSQLRSDALATGGAQ